MFERTASLEYVGSQPTIVEEGSGSGAEYLPMQPPTTTRNRTLLLCDCVTFVIDALFFLVACPPKRSRGPVTDSTDNNDSSASYVEMNSADKARRMTGDSGYMEMASPMRAASSVTSILTKYFFICFGRKLTNFVFRRIAEQFQLRSSCPRRIHADGSVEFGQVERKPL